jgi:hypothetical protein
MLFCLKSLQEIKQLPFINTAYLYKQLSSPPLKDLEDSMAITTKASVDDCQFVQTNVTQIQLTPGVLKPTRNSRTTSTLCYGWPWAAEVVMTSSSYMFSCLPPM